MLWSTHVSRKKNHAHTAVKKCLAIPQSQKKKKRKTLTPVSQIFLLFFGSAAEWSGQNSGEISLVDARQIPSYWKKRKVDKNILRSGAGKRGQFDGRPTAQTKKIQGGGALIFPALLSSTNNSKIWKFSGWELQSLCGKWLCVSLWKALPKTERGRGVCVSPLTLAEGKKIMVNLFIAFVSPVVFLRVTLLSLKNFFGDAFPNSFFPLLLVHLAYLAFWEKAYPMLTFWKRVICGGGRKKHHQLCGRTAEACC